MSENSGGWNTAKATRPEVNRLEESDLPEAARIVRLAFGTFLGAPDPETFWADRDYVYGRQPASHVASFGAKLEGKLVGTNFATNWGSVGFFGPLTVHPDLQQQGIAQALLARTMEQFDSWKTRQVGLFTFAQSAKHIALYQKYGFYARFLTAIMSAKAMRQTTAGWSRFSKLSQVQQEEALRSCRDLAETLYAGLDLTDEIRATHTQHLGDVVLVEGAGGVAAFAVCHYGPRSEAGADTCFIKFGAVRSGTSAERDYLRLLDACEALTVAVGMTRLLAGANMARHEAYRHLVARGFRTEIQGVAMHRQNDPGYCRPGVYIIDDWRYHEAHLCLACKTLARHCEEQSNEAPHSRSSSPAKAGDPVFRGASDGIESPRRTGYPACTGYDGGLGGGAKRRSNPTTSFRDGFRYGISATCLEA